MGGRVPVDVEAADDEILVPFGNTIDENKRENKAFLRTLWAASDACEVLFYADIRNVFSLEVRHVLCRLLIRLLDDFTKYACNYINNVFRWYDARSI